MRLTSVILCTALAGCASEETSQDPIDPEEGETCEGVEVRLGTGAVQFEEVADGDTVYLYRGPQGGYMIYFAVQARGLNPAGVLVEYEERLTDSGEVFGQGQWNVKLSTDLGDGWYGRNGIWGEVEESYFTRPLAIRGHEIETKVTLTDVDGCQVSGLGWTVMVHPDSPM